MEVRENAACSKMAPQQAPLHEAASDIQRESYPIGKATHQQLTQDTLMEEKVTPLVLCDGGLMDVGALLKTLPTKTYLHVMMADLKEELRRETLLIREKMALLQKQVHVLTTAKKETDTKVAAVDSFCTETGAQFLELRLRMEKFDDVQRRQALRVKGLPPTRTMAELRETLMVLFCQVLVDGGMTLRYALTDCCGSQVRGEQEGIWDRETWCVIWLSSRSGNKLCRGPGT